MEKRTENQYKIYKPRHSIGGYILYISVILVIIISFLLFYPAVFGPLDMNNLLILLFSGPIWLAIVIVGVLFLIWYPSMRYVLDNEKLCLKCGPRKKLIKIKEIKKIRKKNFLSYDSKSKRIQLPGYCVFRTKYSKEGWINMFSRSPRIDIVIIETKDEKYGVNPKDENSFINSIEQLAGKSLFSEV